MAKKPMKKMGTAKVGDFLSTTMLLTKEQRKYLLRLSRETNKPLSETGRLLFDVLRSDEDFKQEGALKIADRIRERIRQEKRAALDAKRAALDREVKALDDDAEPQPA